MINGFAVVEYENGARACHMECFVASMSDRFYTVVGTHGLATLSLSGRTITVTKRWGGEKIVYEIPAINLGGHAGADPRLVESFLRTIQGLESNRSTIEQGMLSTAHRRSGGTLPRRKPRRISERTFIMTEPENR